MDLNKILTELATQCLMIAIPILVPALFALIVAKFKEAWTNAKYYYPSATTVLEDAANMAVTAAEQFANTDEFKLLYTTKKDYALDIAQQFLTQHNVNLPVSLIEAAIESAVKDCFNKDK